MPKPIEIVPLVEYVEGERSIVGVAEVSIDGTQIVVIHSLDPEALSEGLRKTLSGEAHYSISEGNNDA